MLHYTNPSTNQMINNLLSVFSFYFCIYFINFKIPLIFIMIFKDIKNNILHIYSLLLTFLPPYVFVNPNFHVLAYHISFMNFSLTFIVWTVWTVYWWWIPSSMMAWYHQLISWLCSSERPHIWEYFHSTNLSWRLFKRTQNWVGREEG